MVPFDLSQVQVGKKILRLLQPNPPRKAPKGSASHCHPHSCKAQVNTALPGTHGCGQCQFPQAAGLVTRDLPEDYPSVRADLGFNWPSAHLPHFSPSGSQKPLWRRGRWLSGECILKAPHEGHLSEQLGFSSQRKEHVCLNTGMRKLARSS